MASTAEKFVGKLAPSKNRSQMWNSAMLTVVVAAFSLIPSTVSMFYGIISPALVASMAAVIAGAGLAVGFINHDVEKLSETIDIGASIIRFKEDPSLIMTTVSILGFLTFLRHMVSVLLVGYMVCTSASLVWSMVEDSQNPLYIKDDLEAYLIVFSLVSTLFVGVAPIVLAWRRMSICWTKATYKSAINV